MEIAEQKKTCGRCKRMLPLDSFHKNAARSGGLSPQCRNCKREIKKLSQEKHNPNKNNPRDWIGKGEVFPGTSLILKEKVKGKQIFKKNGKKNGFLAGILADCLCGNKDVFLIPYDLKNGYTISCCATCVNSVMSKKASAAAQEFVQKANAKHNNAYDYSKAIYKTSRKKIIIICPKHGEFKQAPSDHLKGQGCPNCSINISKGETRWLDHLGLPNKKGVTRTVPLVLSNGKKIVADGYDPQTNTVYEYHGDYWHGNLKRYDPDQINRCNKKTMAQLFEKTCKRSQAIRAAGYNLISIWESEWEKQERTLAAAGGGGVQHAAQTTTNKT